MKREITEFVSRCLVCQQVKAKHQVPSGLLQPIMIPEWKLERVTMDFILGLPLTPKKGRFDMNGQSERIIHILEDMLRCCVTEFKGS
ncbi:integrase [Gossypium australe]|uniref:Integrase n=1 Tax=Gossypium australe TaxID=47621 RepID=A0A5B6VAV4_9ROSI|nr:integrase [Gossypium australe]